MPTPIGNLKDLSIRQYEALTQSDIIACEDTRNTGKLLSLIKERRISEKFRQHMGARFEDVKEQSQKTQDNMSDEETHTSHVSEENYSDESEEDIQNYSKKEDKPYKMKTYDISGLEEVIEDNIEPKKWWSIEENDELNDEELQAHGENTTQLESPGDQSLIDSDRKLSNQRRMRLERSQEKEIR